MAREDIVRKKMVRDDVSRTLREILVADGRLVLAYLFGSQATGRAGPRSDVDVGVLLSGDEATRRQAHGELMDALVRRLGTEAIDLVDLREAPIPLRYRVIRDGQLLHSSDEKARQRFETDTVMRYLDFKPIRDQAFRTAREAIVGTG